MEFRFRMNQKLVCLVDRMMHTSYRYYVISVFLSFISALVVWGVMYLSMSSNSVSMVECFVPKGEQKQQVLPDGTKVQLNSGSLLIYPENFSESRRSVFLSGEGYFEVVQKEHTPFVVHTNNHNIKVLGTKFNVQSYPDGSNFVVTLEKGKIEVTSYSEQKKLDVVLEPGQCLVHNSITNNYSLSKVNVQEQLQWKEGCIRFVRQPLSSILKTLERAYNIEIRTGESINLAEKYTMTFYREEPSEQVMRILALTIDSNVCVRQKGNLVYLDKM